MAYVKAFTGIDPNGSSADFTVGLNSAFNWSFTDTVSNSQTSFYDVVLHELTHGIGFVDAIDVVVNDDTVDPNDITASSRTSGNRFSVFERYLGDSQGLLIGSDGSFDQNRLDDAIVGGAGVLPNNPIAGTNGLYFYGPTAMAANGGQAVPLYSPGEFSPGSSIAHIDSDAFTGSNNVLEHALSRGVFIGELSELEIAIMRDLGFTLFDSPTNPIPEPSGVLLAFIGSFLAFLRRQR